MPAQLFVILGGAFGALVGVAISYVDFARRHG
jgi:hypothetical protein